MSLSIRRDMKKLAERITALEEELEALKKKPKPKEKTDG